MTQLILDIKQESDLDVLLPLLKRLGIKYIPTVKKKNSTHKKLQQSAKILDEGGDENSYFNQVDALDWQREQRQDRNLPYIFSDKLDKQIL